MIPVAVRTRLEQLPPTVQRSLLEQTPTAFPLWSTLAGILDLRAGFDSDLFFSDEVLRPRDFSTCFPPQATSSGCCLGLVLSTDLGGVLGKVGLRLLLNEELQLLGRARPPALLQLSQNLTDQGQNLSYTWLHLNRFSWACNFLWFVVNLIAEVGTSCPASLWLYKRVCLLTSPDL